MKTIKIIDLLNKIANGEEVPKKIKYGETEYIANNRVYVDFNGDLLLPRIRYISKLNDEVEILEEEKKIPEKLEPLQKDYMTLDDIKFTFSNSEMILVDKINSIIDYLKSKGE